MMTLSWRSPRFWGILFVSIAAFFLSIYPVRSQTPTLCSPGDADYFPTQDLIFNIISPDQAGTTSIIVEIQNQSHRCAYQVGTASYLRHDESIDTQEIFDYQTGVVEPNSYIYLSLNHHQYCATQLDIFFGDVLLSLNGQRYGQRLVYGYYINGTNCIGQDNPLLLVVNSRYDTDDGVCDIEHCSLREAIAQASATPIDDEITFELIRLQSERITLTHPIIIDSAIVLRSPERLIYYEPPFIIDGDPMDGAGFVITENGSLTAYDLYFSGFSSATVGGVFNNAGDLTLYDCDLWHNNALQAGGAIYSSGGQVSLLGTGFYRNEAGRGGAVMMAGGTLVTNSTTHNRTGFDTNLSSDGSAIVADPTTTIDLHNTVFESNSSSGTAAGVQCVGCTMVITNSLFDYNHAVAGSAVELDGNGIVTITQTEFIGNRADSAGLILVHNGTMAIHESNLLNTTTNDATSYDVVNNSATVLDASNNYWGAADGPSGFGPGSGDSVSANVIFEPFYTVPSGITTLNVSSDGNSAGAPVDTCATDAESVTIGDGLATVCSSTSSHHNVSARRLDYSGIGVQSVIDQGVIQAIDITGWLSEPLEVCLSGEGGILFLDATNSPRVPVWMPTTTQNDSTCTTITTEGTVVLVSTNEYAGSTSSQTARVLETCRVRTLYLLNLRDAPDGAVIGQVPYDLTLQAIGRRSDWFNVVIGDNNGWISARHVTEIGNCDN